jgi:hypothetical protein
MIAHWLDLINVDGWIPHQQVLGDEAQRYPTKYTCPSTSPPQNLILRLKWAEEYACGLREKKLYVGLWNQFSSLGCENKFYQGL